MSLELYTERIRTHIIPAGVTFEQKITNADNATSYVGWARAGSSLSSPKWIILRIKSAGNTVTYRWARTDSSATDQEVLNKVYNDYASYDYVD